MSKKAKITAAVVCLALIVAAAAVITQNREKIVIRSAVRDIHAGDYSRASGILEYGDGEYAAQLKKYVALRTEIKDTYPALLGAYDEDTLKKWQSESGEISASGAIEDSQINSALDSIEAQTGLILSVDSMYSTIKDDVLTLLDVFTEYNRLHIQINGENAVFTLHEEYAKLEKWQKALDKIRRYATSVPDYESVYLLSYLLKEGQSEIVQLRNEIDSVSAEGYGEYDSVHYSDNTARNFPSIKDGKGTVITFKNKAVFEKYLHESIREQLVSNGLIKFYYNIGG